MSNETRTDTHGQLDALWGSNEAPALPIEDHKYVIISDLHLGNGGRADNFGHNREVFLQATRHYLEQQYCLILAGDTEDLWQFDLREVTKSYKATVYSRLEEFAKQGRLVRVFGNHDREWGLMPDPILSSAPGRGCPEGVKLTDANHRPRILVVHGHQGSADADRGSWASKFFVRLYRYVEPLLHRLSDDPAATRSGISSDYERMMYGWAKARHVLLVCGHSHRAVAASLSYTQALQRRKAELEKKQRTTAPAVTETSLLPQLNAIDAEIAHEKERGRNFTPVEDTDTPTPCYFNSGCCCYKDGLTAIEIAGNQIALVKWSPQRVVFQSMPLEKCLTSI